MTIAALFAAGAAAGGGGGGGIELMREPYPMPMTATDNHHRFDVRAPERRAASAERAVAACRQRLRPPPCTEPPRGCAQRVVELGSHHRARPQRFHRSHDGGGFLGSGSRSDLGHWCRTDQSGTLPCLRRGSSSRLVRSMRRPATTFWRVSA